MFFSPQFRNSSVCVGVLSCNQQQLTTSYHSNDNFHWQTLFLFCFFLFCFFPIKQSNRFNSILFCFLSRRRWWWFEYLFQFRYVYHDKSIKVLLRSWTDHCPFRTNVPLCIEAKKEQMSEGEREREREREREIYSLFRMIMMLMIIIIIMER